MSGETEKGLRTPFSPRKRVSEYHALTWLAWLAGALLPALTTRNPLYLTVLLLMVGVIYAALGTGSPLAQSWGTFIRLGLILWGFTIVFDALTAHYGGTHLLRLPGNWPVVGGPITLEAVLFGAISGMALATLVLTFATFNAVVDHYQLLRWVPAFLYQAGVVTGIALTFVPQTVASLQEIREAQTLRGHRFRGVRDLLPLLVPLLTSGLERAIQLAESMEARGFGYLGGGAEELGSGGAGDQTSRGAEGQGSRGAEGHSPLLLRTSAPLLNRAGLVVALLGACSGLFAYQYLPSLRLPSLLVLAVSLGLLAFLLRGMGRRVARSRYRRHLWRRWDTVVALACGLSIVAFGALWVARPGLLAYDPYPRAIWPTFEPLVVLALLPLLAPAVCAPASGQFHQDIPGQQGPKLPRESSDSLSGLRDGSEP